MKKIFILKGNPNTGKTTKINTIADWIINNYSIPNTIKLDPADFKLDTHGILTIKKLTIGINSAGDDFESVRKIDDIAINSDIILCACRTKGITYQHIYKNYNFATGWLDKIIYVEEYLPTQTIDIYNRDLRIIEELKTWLIGLEK